MTKLSGPSKLPKTQNPDKLVLFLHGVGADGHDLLSLSNEFTEIFPNAVFLSPNAPFPYDEFPMGYQWFSLRDRSENRLLEGIRIALPILQSYIDENLAKYNLDYKDLILIGFSQGTMMALQLAPRLSETCFAVIGFSGALVAPQTLAVEMKSKPSIFLAHGDEDQVVQPSQHRFSVTSLKNMQIPVEEHLLSKNGHNISLEAINLAKNFLKSR